MRYDRLCHNYIEIKHATAQYFASLHSIFIKYNTYDEEWWIINYFSFCKIIMKNHNFLNLSNCISSAYYSSDPIMYLRPRALEERCVVVYDAQDY